MSINTSTKIKDNSGAPFSSPPFPPPPYALRENISRKGLCVCVVGGVRLYKRN